MAQNGILNALQAASNVAADNVAFPVDALAWLLRKAGVPVPANPVLGSDWLRERGLTAPVEPGWSKVAGETVGLVSPAMVSQFGPHIRLGGVQVHQILGGEPALLRYASLSEVRCSSQILERL